MDKLARVNRRMRGNAIEEDARETRRSNNAWDDSEKMKGNFLERNI